MDDLLDSFLDILTLHETALDVIEVVNTDELGKEACSELRNGTVGDLRLQNVSHELG